MGAVQRKYPLLFEEVEDRAPSLSSLGQGLSSHLLYTAGFTWHLSQVICTQKRQCRGSWSAPESPSSLPAATWFHEVIHVGFLWPRGLGQWQSVCKECEDLQLLGNGWGSCLTAVWLFSSPASPAFWCGICSVLVPSLPLKSSLVIWTCDIFHPWDALSSFCFDIGDAFKKILFVFTWDVAHCCQKLNLIHYYGVLRLGKNPRGNLMWMKKHNPKDIKKDNLVMRGCGKQTRILIFVSWTPKCSHLIIRKFEDSSTK